MNIIDYNIWLESSYYVHKVNKMQPHTIMSKIAFLICQVFSFKKLKRCEKASPLLNVYKGYLEKPFVGFFKIPTLVFL